MKHRAGSLRLCRPSIGRAAVMALLVESLPAPATGQSCATPPTTTLVSRGLGTPAAPANGVSFNPSLSSDGRIVAFCSAASNLVVGDTNSMFDAFTHERSTGITRRVTEASNGGNADAETIGVHLAGNGEHVVFATAATNIVSGDINGVSDVFLRDLRDWSIRRISVTSSGQEANAASFNASVSESGRFVVFVTLASNLAPHDTNGTADVCLWDALTGTPELVSVATNGLSGNEASGLSGRRCVTEDGRLVAFQSLASDLVAGDTNDYVDVFVRDRVLGTTRRVSVLPDGTQGDAHSWISEIDVRGGVVGFNSTSVAFSGLPFPTIHAYWMTLADGGVHSLLSSIGTALIDSECLGVDPSGSHVLFYASDSVIPGDANGHLDLFVIHLLTGQVVRANLGNTGVQTNSWTYPIASLSYRAREIAFTSNANNLVPGDVNQLSDAFVRDLGVVSPRVYCAAKLNSLGCLPTLATTGTPCVQPGGGLRISAGNVLNGRSGILFIGTSGAVAAPFLGGTLCVSSPLRRIATQNSGGNVGAADCSGRYDFDLDGAFQVGAVVALPPGATVWAQIFSRDGGFAPPNNVGLTAAVEFDLGPY
jgi:Tol biopolymer transport system component